MAERTKFAAFMSYTRLNDRHDNGRISELRERLQAEVEVQSGEPFTIFQDREDIGWGQAWKRRIEQAIDETTFLIPIVTPSLLRSAPCREEILRFVEREKRLDRDDLVLPLIYVRFAELDDDSDDEVVAVLRAHNWARFEDLRFEPWTTPGVGRRIEALAILIRDAIARNARSADVQQHASKPASPAMSTGSQEVTLQVATQSDPAVARSLPTPPRTEPPTLVVDQMPGRGDHRTIAAAIAASEAGGRILVRPGLYHEGLRIDKPLEIIGDGPRHEIVIEATDSDAVLFETDFGRISNLTFRQRGGGMWYGIDITQGSPQLEDCEVSCDSLACIAVRGGADPRVRRMSIHGSAQSGIFVYDGAKGTFEDNEILGNAYAGVEVRDFDSDPVFRKNRIVDNKQNGIQVHGGGKGTFEDNEISRNAYAGAEVRDPGSEPVLRKNRIVESQQHGIYVHDAGAGAFEDNEISGSAFAGVAVRDDGSQPLFRKNRIIGGKQSGVIVYDGGNGTFEDNEITGNTFAGVEVKSAGAPFLTENRIADNGYEAIWVYEGGKGTYKANTLEGNGRGHWDIDKSSKSHVVRKDNIEVD